MRDLWVRLPRAVKRRALRTLLLLARERPSFKITQKAIRKPSTRVRLSEKRGACSLCGAPKPGWDVYELAKPHKASGK